MWERQGKDWLTHSLSRRLACPTIQTTAYPSTQLLVNTCPSVGTLNDPSRLNCTQIGRGVRIALVQNPWSHQHRHVNADGFVTEQFSTSTGGYVCPWGQHGLADQEYNAIIVYVRFAFASQLNSIIPCWCLLTLPNGFENIRGGRWYCAVMGKMKNHCAASRLC